MDITSYPYTRLGTGNAKICIVLVMPLIVGLADRSLSTKGVIATCHDVYTDSRRFDEEDEVNK